MEDLTAASLDDVKAFFRTLLHAQQPVAGDRRRLRSGRGQAAGREVLRRTAGRPGAGPAAALDPELDGEKVVEVDGSRAAGADLLRLARRRHTSAPATPSSIWPRSILADGLSSRLDKSLVYDKPLASERQRRSTTAGDRRAVFVVIATARAGVVAAGHREDGHRGDRSSWPRPARPQAELDRARTKQEFQFVSGLERIGGFGGKADLLNQYNTFLGDPGKFDADVQRYRGADRGQRPRRGAAAGWRHRNRLIVRFQPEASGRAAERHARPRQGAGHRRRPPLRRAGGADRERSRTAWRSTSSSAHDLPKVAVSFATRAGTIADPAGKEGVAANADATIDLGTTTRNGARDRERARRPRHRRSAAAPREYSTLGFEVLTRNLGPALAIVADVVQRPEFPAAEVDREKKRQLDALASRRTDPNTIATAACAAMLAFGADHPYGWPAQGLPATVGRDHARDLAALSRDLLAARQLGA